MEWNPNAPGKVGPEWFPYLSGQITLDSPTKAAVMAYRQTTAQTIGGARIGVGSIPVRGGLYAVEFYDNETAVGGANLATLKAQPNEDVTGDSTTYGTNSGQWHTDASATTNLYQAIDETLPSGGTDDYVGTSKGGGTAQSNKRYAWRFNTGGLSLTGKRILAVTMKVGIWARVGGVTGIGPIWSAGLKLSGSDYYLVQDTTASGSGGPGGAPNPYEWTLPYNPATKKPWTIADVQALDTTDNAFLKVTLPSSPYGFQEFFLMWASLEVRVCDENRLAVGVLDDSASGLTPNVKNLVTLTGPTGSGNWSKDGSGYHTVVVRRISSSGALTVPTLDSGVAPYGAYTFPAPSVDSTYGYLTAMGSPGTSAFALDVRTTAPADSVDSQPYYQLVEALVFSGQDAEQEFSNGDSKLYRTIEAIVAPGGASQPLSVKVKKRSDNSQVGGTATVNVVVGVGDDVVAVTSLGGGLYRIQVELPTDATLVAATQYYIEFSSTATGAGGNYWTVLGVDTQDTADNATYGSNTDVATILGGEDDRYDLLATFTVSPDEPSPPAGSPPAAVAGFAGTIALQSIDPAICNVDTIERASLTWTATALSTDFDYYEIQRSIDGGTTWDTIRYVWTEAVTGEYVAEMPRTVETLFRIRVVSVSGGASPWSSSVALTADPGCAEMLFISDADPTLNVAFDREPSIRFEMLDSGQAVLVPIYGRDYQLGFLPTERMGVRATTTLNVGVDDRPAPGNGESLAAFDALRAIATAEIPYVCVLDKWGMELRVLLQVPTGDHLTAGGLVRYIAQIVATEVTDTPQAYEID